MTGEKYDPQGTAKLKNVIYANQRLSKKMKRVKVSVILQTTKSRPKDIT